MSMGKRFRVRFEQEDGKGEIVNEKGVELTAREVVDSLNELEMNYRQLQYKYDFQMSLAETKIKNREKEIKSLEQRSKQLFLMEKVIDKIFSEEEKIEFYNMLKLEMIKDE